MTTGIAIGLLLLRLGTGLTMAAHGYQKFFAGGRIAGTAGWFDSIGMRPGRVHALAAATTELGAGLLLALGLLTPLAGAAFVALMLVAAWTVHRSSGFFIVKGGWEYNLVLALIGGTLGFTGGGPFSLDHLLGVDDLVPGLLGGLIAVVGGLLAGTAQLLLFFRPRAAEQAG